MRDFLRGFGLVVGLGVWAFTGWLVYFALHIPLEGGAIIITPALLLAAFLTFVLGLVLAVPRAFRKGGWGRQLLSGLDQLFIGWF